MPQGYHMFCLVIHPSVYRNAWHTGPQNCLVPNEQVGSLTLGLPSLECGPSPIAVILTWFIFVVGGGSLFLEKQILVQTLQTECSLT